MEQQIPQLKNVYEARKVINYYLKKTPLIYSRRLSKLLDCQVYLKLENLQPTRAFKVRGGIYYIEKMRDRAMSRGVIAASTGNHAQSLAYAGSLYGVQVKIIMPVGVPEMKVEAVKDLGAEVIMHGSYYEEAREYAEQLASEKEYLYVHASNEPLLHEGVATMHLEIIEEQPDIDTVINPIGGGSGASGACIVYKTLDPSIRVIGVQAEGAPAFYRSWKDGVHTQTSGVNTAAEGLATAQAYDLPLKILREKLDDVILVNDSEMEQAIRTIFTTTGQVAELSGAASTAGAFKIKDQLSGRKIVLMVTGGNIQPEQLASILERKLGQYDLGEETKRLEIEREREEKNTHFRQAPDSPIVRGGLREFSGLKYYPVDSSYRFQVKLNRYHSPQTVTMWTSAGTQRNYVCVGYFELKLDEKKQRLQVYKPVGTLSFERQTLFIPFRDKTSGVETYGSGRYIDIPENDRGDYELDFNRAYNPYCAYSENYVCPITPNENWLDAAIRAGEKSYKQH